MRAGRLLSILLLLQAHRRMTAHALAQRLEVSARTIHRDMDALSAAGVPVYAERGHGGGWVLPETYRTNLTGLHETEVQALFLAMPPRLLADLGLRDASQAALVKLLAALPAVSRRDAEEVGRRIHIDSTGWRRPEEAVPFLPTLQDALWQERRLRLAYARGDGTAVERLVDPLGLVAKGSLWYLVAAVEGEPRTYRVSRVQATTLTDEPCLRPPEFDLVAYWAGSAARFVASLPRYPLTVRVAADALPRVSIAAGYVHVEEVSPPDADGWHTVRVLLQTEEDAYGYVLGFGTRIEVLEPPELRERVAEIAAGVAAFYARTVSDSRPALAAAAGTKPA